MEAQATQGSALEPAFAEAKNRLKEAEAEVARLQNALNKLKQQLQVNNLLSVLSVSEFLGAAFSSRISSEYHLSSVQFEISMGSIDVKKCTVGLFIEG